MTFDYFVNVKALNESQNDVLELLDEMMYENFGFHIMEPYSNITTIITARPVLYQTRTDYNMKERSLSSALPRHSKNIR
jgi:hypothetical protein